jgi:hypothetical protein
METLQTTSIEAGCVTPAAFLPQADSTPALPSSGKEPLQQVLFVVTPRGLCDEIGLNWWAALKLHEDGWLTFSPEQTSRLDDSQEAELRFVGSLVMSGCDRRMLKTLLSTLPRPYAYHGSRLYYDWARRHWRVLPDPKAHPEATFAEWVESLVKKDDHDSLCGILELTHDAIARLQPKPPHHEL